MKISLIEITLVLCIIVTAGAAGWMMSELSQKHNDTNFSVKECIIQ